MPGKCKFSDLWLEIDAYKAGLLPCTDDRHRARCKLCMKDFDILNMGEAALESHAKGTFHQDKIKLCSTRQNPTLAVFFDHRSITPSSTTAVNNVNASVRVADSGHSALSDQSPVGLTITSASSSESALTSSRLMARRQRKFYGFSRWLHLICHSDVQTELAVYSSRCFPIVLLPVNLRAQRINVHIFADLG
jgi:hypothetical protein